MSKWKTVKDADDVDISYDGKTLEVYYDSDDFGNNYIEIPIDMILQKLNNRNTA